MGKTLSQFLNDSGIGTLIHYPVPRCRRYKGLGYKKGDFPIAEELADTLLSLPIWSTGMRASELASVMSSVKFLQRVAER